MKTQRRWMKAAIAASAAPIPAMPWTRGQRRKSAQPQTHAPKVATAAR